MIKYLMLIVTALMLSSCSLMLLSAKSSETKDVIRLQSPSPEFLDIVAKVGKEEGFEVRKAAYRSGILDPSIKSPQSLFMNYGVGSGDAALASLTGRLRVIGMEFSSDDNGKTWNCTVHVHGNFSAGDEDAALNYWSEFKPKLLQRIQNASFGKSSTVSGM
ncbi:MAG TPA: hypothetical protein VJ508_05555 [Saprospiraceae bacterium]|nr:hypothetical protein [Saprospiraceae bacterium]